MKLSVIEETWLSTLRGSDLATLEHLLNGQHLSSESRRVLTDVIKQLQVLSAQGNGSLLARVGTGMYWEAVSIPKLERHALSGSSLVVADAAAQAQHLYDALSVAGSDVTLVLPSQWEALMAKGDAQVFERVIFCRTASENDVRFRHHITR